MDAEVIQSPEIWHRDDFSVLCNWRKLFVAVEVGVDRGEWAQEFLRFWKGTLWFGVDTWAPYPEMNFDRTADYHLAIERIKPYAGHCKLIKGESVAISRLMAPSRNQPQFVYIDGNHDYAAVKADLNAWWAALDAEGILAGHDYDDDHPGVIKAVKELAVRERKTVYLTNKDGPQFSWYIYKGGMPDANWVRNPK